MLYWLVLAAQLLGSVEVIAAFRVRVSEAGQIAADLETSDLRENVTAYAAQISGEPRPAVLPFGEPGRPVLFNASFHGLRYSVGLLLQRGLLWSRPVESVSLLTSEQTSAESRPVPWVRLSTGALLSPTGPLPVSSVHISDYKDSPETGVVFDIDTPAGNLFSRVNISYSEGSERRSMLYKDFYEGKTVFKHWLPGVCYRNVTFQLISEASAYQTAQSDITHMPVHHRTVPYPPLDISWSVVDLSQSPTRESRPAAIGRRSRDVPGTQEEEPKTSEEPPLARNRSAGAESTDARDRWPDSAAETSAGSEDEFVNGEALEYEDSNDAGSAMALPAESLVLPAKMFPVLLELRWLPPRAPTSYDGFHIYIGRDGNTTQTASVDESTHEFFTELSEAGTYSLRVATLSAAGDCEARESAADAGFTFYLGPKGELLRELRQRPRAVTVHLLDSSTAAVSWARSSEAHDGSIVSVVSSTCLKPSPSQRVESNYCSEENSTSAIVGNLTPGAQYRVVVYHTNGPLISPPSEAVIMDIEPTGVQDLAVYPLSPTAVILSWQRPYQVAFRKYVLQTFFFNPVTLSSEWSTYYEIAATASVIASVRVTDLLPAWYYKFRVTMVTWGEPPLTCCDGSTVSFVTAPEAPHISSVDYSHGVLYVRWTYGELFVDLSHSRITHWQVVAVGKKGSERSYSVDVSVWLFADAVALTLSRGLSRLLPSSLACFLLPSLSSFLPPSLASSLACLLPPSLASFLSSRMRPELCRYFCTWQVTRNAMRASLPLPPGDIYNLTVTACTERGRNTSVPGIIKLDPAPPRSVHAVNATHSSVTLLWSEDGVADHYQVLCRASPGGKEVKTGEPRVSGSQALTVSGLMPSSSYNCSVVSVSYSTPSKPAHVTFTTAAKEMNPSVAAISALAILSVLLLGLLLLFLLLLRKKHLQMSRECGAETFVNFASFERDGKLPYNWRRSLFAFLTLLPSCLWTDYLLAFYINPWGKTALKKRKLTSPVQLADFEAYFKELSKDSAYKFSLQFEELKSVGLDLSHDSADLPVNRPKNRYTNILPYDFSRVRLFSLHDDEGDDYINANYIPGYKHAKEYIATQGPLPETRNDFWKMVLQQKSPIVVMLTQCNERRRVKCDHYWPFSDEPVTYGEISVEMLSENESPEWTVRKFRLGYADETRDILHLNYTSWPDHGVPTVNAIESILQFVRIVRQQANKTKEPVVVHCSAGVGRTGTFMALDRLMQHIREHDFVDIMGMVAEMRSHRLSMVQTEEQYVFIHQCVLLMWQKKKQQQQPPLTSDVIYENAGKT
ncbi:receptor-type tyrosine-protein phosphatase O isoform X3 [Syngnathus typhle]|uniref:receptor-type tyrosine-protein phosphatase O isoform X3 n=1 Tax=Syngnathus typhle TaxID=161592 RepID=UPI002A6AB2DD|nr:receptor-type tyrosine-protein phosphatase O isoform X3 [Syngnathus typhle]